MAYVYILQSLKDNSYYVGSSQDCERRLGQHNSGNVKATRNKRPYRIVFSQKFESILEAERIERKIKSWKRRDYIERIVEDGRIKFVDKLGT